MLFSLWNKETGEERKMARQKVRKFMKRNPDKWTLEKPEPKVRPKKAAPKKKAARKS